MRFSPLGRGLFLAAIGTISAAFIMILWVLWRFYVPTVIANGNLDRFFGPAVTVSASLLIAVSITGSTLITRYGPKNMLLEFGMFAVGVVSLLVGLFFAIIGLIAGPEQASWVPALVFYIPLTWVVAVILLLAAMAEPFLIGFWSM